MPRKAVAGIQPSSTAIMSNLHDFLVEHATFPFPQPTNEGLSVGITDISLVEVPLLEREWKANHAVRDNTLTPFWPADAENKLLSRFSPRIQLRPNSEEESDWKENPSESHVNHCLSVYGQYDLVQKLEQVADRGNSRVDYVLKVNGEDGCLLEAALYLGLRRMEWLFITCHNYWIVCRLVRDDHHPFLAYSPMISIDDSSVPFRALLGAILSVVKKVPVEPIEFNPNMELDIIVEERDEGPLPEDGSAYSASSGEEIASDPPNTHNRHRTGQRKAESGLMITSSSQNSPESSQIWIHLHPFSNNMLALPQCAKNGKRRLWLTRFCHFDGSVDFFIAKIVEVLRRTDAGNRQRLHDEFKIYLALEKAYQSRQPHDRIAPHCYGAFEGDGVAVLILDLCDGVLNEWGELSDPERSQVYKLVRDLHRIRITHGDLEPRNIARAREGGFCLIDFSESRRHTCKGSKMCPELQTFRKCLWKGQPLG
ncbi:hypothetical protein F5887DRAFT_1272389 [Amanita rubescens]|nr:hypothetical protein F5887DRAFT_1272389 [Amanita rubescens]